MPCPVAVTGLTATVDANNPVQTDLTINGTTTRGGCNSIDVDVSDENRHANLTGTDVISGAQWTVTLAGTAVQCGDVLLVTAHCYPKDGEPCQGETQKPKVTCTGECPTLGQPSAVVSSTLWITASKIAELWPGIHTLLQARGL